LPADGLWKTFGASVLVLLTGLVLLFQATERGSAFTTEVLRRATVDRRAQPIPNLSLRDDQGNQTTLHDLLSTDSRISIVDFVYLRCRTVCTSLGSSYQRLQQQIVERGLQSRVQLLSVSFDPANDDITALRDYAQRMRLDPAAWRVVTLASADDRQLLLDAFGIVVIPAPLGEFEHNAALHIVNSKSMLVRIIDVDDAARALEFAVAAAGP